MASLAYNKFRGCDTSTDEASLAANVTGLLIPGVTGLGLGVRAAGKVTNGGVKALPSPKVKGPKGNANGAPKNGTIFVDSKGNAIPTPPGGRITGSGDSRFIQARDASGNPTGVRIDGAHSPKTHTDPRALGPHGHVPGVTNTDGTPWLPIKQ